MEKITFVIPSRNNLEFLKLAYDSIKRLGNSHEILVLNDASNDGTTEWLQSLNDNNLLVYDNPGPERIGIVGMFDKGIEMARTDIIMAFHADMVAGPKLDQNILKYLEQGTVVSATRVEPPLHPPGPEKIIENFGIEADEFDYDKWEEWCAEIDNGDYTTEGVFAPWCMYKDDFLAIGGHDELFAPQSREDSDLFSRFLLNGYKFKQPWGAVVYHFTSRGSRFNKHAGGSTGVDSPEWIGTNSKNEKNYIRKWGHFPQCTAHMKPVVFPKYDIGFVVKNCSMEILTATEPWCSTIYADEYIMKYITTEQPNTSIDLSKRCYSINSEICNDIEVRIDGERFTNNDYQNLRKLPLIIRQNNELGTFELGNLEISINSLETYEHNLIINEEKKNGKN